MTFVQQNWYRIGGVIAVGVLGALAFFGQNLSAVQFILLLNFVAILIHQFEEYVYPGTFPGHWNAEVSRSDQPSNYPLNARSSMIANMWFGWPIYLVPVFFPQLVWLGLAPALFGFTQVLSHGLLFPLRSAKLYSPGAITAVLLYLPIGIAFVREAQPTGLDWIIALALVPIIALISLAGPIKLLANRASPHHFEERQLRTS